MSGSTAAEFDELYRTELSAMVRLAHLLTGSNIAADDIAHEAFLRIHQRWDTVTNPGGYLQVTVVNLSRNWCRSHARRRDRERNAANATAQHTVFVDTDDELLGLVDRLPFRQRAALVARYWLDFPEAEIAELIGCRPGTVKSLTSRAMATLRKELS